MALTIPLPAAGTSSTTAIRASGTFWRLGQVQALSETVMLCTNQSQTVELRWMPLPPNPLDRSTGAVLENGFRCDGGTRKWDSPGRKWPGRRDSTCRSRAAEVIRAGDRAWLLTTRRHSDVTLRMFPTTNFKAGLGVSAYVNGACGPTGQKTSTLM